MSFLYLFLIGILIGSASVVPSVSGSVIAVIFGIYEKAIESFNNLFKDFKKNFAFLFVVGMGVLIGAIWFSNVILFLYEKNEVMTKFSFIGLILGGVPYLFKEVKEKKENINYLALIITFILSLIIFIISKFTISNNASYSFINLLLAGFIYSIGKVVPGISGSFLLMTIGLYNFSLSVISHPITYGLYNIDKVLPFLIGLAIGVIILIKITNYLLNKHFGFTYSIIIGFVLGSIISLLPYPFYMNNLLSCIVVMILSFLLSYYLLKSK